MTKNQKMAQRMRQLADQLVREPEKFILPVEDGEFEYLLRDAAEALEKGEKT